MRYNIVSMEKKIVNKYRALREFSQSSKAIFALLTEIIIGIGLVVLSLFIFFKLAEDIVEKEVISFDVTIIHWVYSFRSPQMTEIMKGITFFGGDIFLTTAIIYVILLLVRTHKKDAFIFSFILAFGTGLNILLKSIFQRPRPSFSPLIHESSYSFPSGHAMNSFVFYTCLSFFIFRRIRNRRWGMVLIILSAVAIVLIGLSRVYLGVHYPSDIIAGYAAGLLWFVIVLWFEKTILFLRLFKKFEAEKKY